MTLVSLNNTFATKTLFVPFAPDKLPIGRQMPSSSNSTANGISNHGLLSPDDGYFESRVLSRLHAELWAEPGTDAVWLRDNNSANGTFVNGVKLASKTQIVEDDVIEFGIDIGSNGVDGIYNPRVRASVERIYLVSLQHSKNNNQLHHHKNSQKVGTANGSLTKISVGKSRPQNQDQQDLAAIEASLFGDLNGSLAQLTRSPNIMEKIIKTLYAELQTARVEAAKLRSVKTHLDTIAKSQQESRLLQATLPSIRDLSNQVMKLTSKLNYAEDELTKKTSTIQDLQETIIGLSVKIATSNTPSKDDIQDSHVDNLQPWPPQNSDPSTSGSEFTVINDLTYNKSIRSYDLPDIDTEVTASAISHDAEEVHVFEQQQVVNYKQRTERAESNFSALVSVNLAIAGIAAVSLFYSKYQAK